MQLFYSPDIEQNHFLPEPEARHALKVLRLGVGESIHVMDGKGNLFEAQILNDNYKKCELIITSKKYIPKRRNFELHIALAPTKNIDRTEWFIEKASEIGIDSISFLLCEHSERKQIKLERIRKVAVSACKQSLKTHLPQLNDLEKFQDFLQKDWATQEKYMAYIHKDEESPLLQKSLEAKKSYLVLIGPEGGFSTQEVSLAKTQDFKIVSLGQERLRTETAALYVCCILQTLQ